MTSHIMKTIVELAGSIDPSLAKSLRSAEEKIKSVDKVSLAVKGTFIAVGVAAMNALAKGTEQAIKFQKQMSNVATLLDGDVNKRVGELSNQLLKVSNRTGVATSDLTDGLYQVISAFGDSAEASKQLEIAAKAAKAGNATTTDAINMLSAVTKGYGDTSAEAQQKASDLAFVTVKLGQTSFPELAASMGKVIPLAATMGVKQEELFGAMATLTGVTGSTAEVTTQLRGAIQGFLQPTKDMVAVMQALGYENGQEMIKAKGLQKSLEMLKTAVGGNDIAFSNLFSSIEAKNAVLAMTGAQSDNLTEKTKAMYKVAGAADEAFKQQTNNIEDLTAKVNNLWSNALTQLGMVVLPIVKVALEVTVPILQILAEHMDALIPIISAVVAGFSSFSIIQSVVGLFELLKLSTIAQTICNGGLSASLQAVWTAMMTNPIGWICVAIGALIGVIVLCVQHWDQIKEAIKSFALVTKDVLSKLLDWITKAFSAIKDVLLAPFKAVNSYLGKMNGKSTYKVGKGDSIPAYASGGFTNGLSIAGEAGTEAIISFDPAYRSNNISTWLKAGEMLGVASSNGSSYNLGGFSFSPNIYISESMSSQDVINRIKSAEGEFMDIIEEFLARQSANSYLSPSNSY